MRRWMTLVAMIAAPALAQTPATVRAPAAPPLAPADLRLPLLLAWSNPALRIDDPRSPLRSGYGGSMVDLFPSAGGNFHLSGGARLFGRAGRRRPIQPESLRLLPAFRGPRLARRFSPALLVGYGRTVERGLALGVDAGMVIGRIVQTPDRLGRLDRARAETGLWRETSRRERGNGLVRMTALYRF